MRDPRYLEAGAEYSVGSRTNRGEMIFENEDTKNLFISIVERAKHKFDFQIHALCIMGNHFHMLIKPGKDENLSKIMQWIKCVFAECYNILMHLTGHVWGDRFFSRIIKNRQDFARTLQYIEENPVRAGLVKEAWEWKFWMYGAQWHHRVGAAKLIEPPDEIFL